MVYSPWGRKELDMSEAPERTRTRAREAPFALMFSL